MTHSSETTNELTDEMLEQVVGGVEIAGFGRLPDFNVGEYGVSDVSVEAVGNDLVVNQGPWH